MLEVDARGGSGRGTPSSSGAGVPKINVTISALRFFFNVTTWALQQVVSYPGYTGRHANVVARQLVTPDCVKTLRGKDSP
jgi:hypothetical protein